MAHVKRLRLCVIMATLQFMVQCFVKSYTKMR